MKITLLLLSVTYIFGVLWQKAFNLYEWDYIARNSILVYMFIIILINIGFGNIKMEKGKVK